MCAAHQETESSWCGGLQTLGGYKLFPDVAQKRADVRHIRKIFLIWPKSGEPYVRHIRNLLMWSIIYHNSTVTLQAVKIRSEFRFRLLPLRPMGNVPIKNKRLVPRYYEITYIVLLVEFLDFTLARTLILFWLQAMLGVSQHPPWHHQCPMM